MTNSIIVDYSLKFVITIITIMFIALFEATEKLVLLF